MSNLSGLKAIDNLIAKYGVGFMQSDNPFQFTLAIPPCSDMDKIREVIKPLGLSTFPHSIWLKLNRVCLDKAVLLHQFKLPQLDGRVFCWILVHQDGQIIEVATEINKVNYIRATKYLSHSIAHHPDTSSNLQLAYG
jgi:hypothetical protein